MLGGVVFSTLRTFLADNAGIGLPLGIERVIGIGSKLTTILVVVHDLALSRRAGLSYSTILIAFRTTLGAQVYFGERTSRASACSPDPAEQPAWRGVPSHAL